ncbi:MULTISPECIES: hypothetical protein [Tenacibaculum]|uniref:hypothetical protein n=1 Tax=Tenacibaculum TaxID=104267 RepID=UPI001F0ABACA|nr:MULTISPECIES: hypothetical protein [Tenacibaculum]MCH3883515.1 hypothetical protein [Tenacibaculum aquimarinum]MDO6598794.1 hypothetical protein [Tenacibaculum sp. 1_MG-2023]
MKYIFKLKFAILAFALVFSSCAIDDDEPTLPSSKVYTVSLSTAGELIADATQESSFVDIRLSEALDTNTQVEYTLNGVSETMIFSPGETSRLFEFPNDSGAFNSLTLDGVRGLYNNVQLGDKQSVSFLVLPAPNPDSIELLAFNDLGEAGALWFGMSAFDIATGDWFADVQTNSAGTHPRPMSLPLDGVGNAGFLIPNDDLLASIDAFMALNLFNQTTSTEPIGFTIYAVFPDGTVEKFTGDVPPGQFVDNAVVGVSVTTDTSSTNPNQVLYSFYEL